MKTFKRYSTFLFLLFSVSSFAQVQINRQLQMTGAGTNAEITGIKNVNKVTGNQDAVNVDNIQRDSLKFAASGGSGNAYTVNLSPAVTGQYTVGMIVHFIAGFSNTSAATLNVNSLGAKTIKKNYNTDLAANDIQSGQAVSVIYDGTNFQMLSQWGGFAHYIGELYGGGIVVAVWDSSGFEHGLIASLTDVSGSPAIWTNASSQSTTVPGVGATSLIDGQANTAAIIAQQTSSPAGAAYLIYNVNINGYSDWYLPALWEIQQCSNSAMIVNRVLGNTNGFKFASYWSSTEASSSGAWNENFRSGTGTYNDAKSDNTINVRAIRRF